jgi:phosphotransferase system  glucose/maltose/N-acetylglucosamine-specific IIC component
MIIFLLIIEIGVAGYLARRLGSEAEDKGFSNALFIVLSIFLWIVFRFAGRLLGIFVSDHYFIAILLGWLFAIVTYMIFFYFISRFEDKQEFDEDKSWKERNQLNPEQTRKEEEI